MQKDGRLQDPLVPFHQGRPLGLDLPQVLFLFGRHLEESISPPRISGCFGQELVKVDAVFLCLQGDTEGIAGKDQIGVEILVPGRAMLLAILTHAKHLEVVSHRLEPVA